MHQLLCVRKDVKVHIKVSDVCVMEQSALVVFLYF